MAENIGQLKIYKNAREAEDQIYELVKQFPADDFYGITNDLRRSSAAVGHYIMEAHRFYSYRLKMDALANARREAEVTIKLVKDKNLPSELVATYEQIIEQSKSLDKWLKTKLEERAAREELETI